MMSNMVDISSNSVFSEKEDFNEFLLQFKESIKTEFDKWNSCEKQLITRGYPKEFLNKIMSHKPLSVAIPKQFGGRGMKVSECLGILEAASYESLSLSLIFGINIALFLEPFHRYGDDSLKKSVYNDFLNNQAMGGLMISEPLHGSDALNMKTSHEKKDNHYHINGLKHWQGLTGMADYWLIACRESLSEGNLSKDISLFMSNEAEPAQKIDVLEIYSNFGLFPIPYGKNKLDIKLPLNSKLIPKSSGIIMLMDVLHRSRMQFPGMGMGFLKRLLEEAQAQVESRHIRGNSLLQFDQVKYNILQLQSAFTICSAMCFKSAQISGVEHDLARHGLQANAIKALVTELMQRASQILIQLQGANGYRISSLGSRAIMDSRPFQIFEGPNEMLFSQVAESVIKIMKKKPFSCLGDYFKSDHKMQEAYDRYKHYLDFNIDLKVSQRKLVRLGEIISRVLIAQYIYELRDAGYNSRLAEATLDCLGQEISAYANSYVQHKGVMPVDYYQEDSNWSTYV